MRVDYRFELEGKEVLISEECEGNKDVFQFLADCQEIFGNTVCEREGQTSDKVRLQVRTDKDDNEYYEMVCFDPENDKCHFAKRRFGMTKKGSLFPKNKNDDGEWQPWVKYNKETGKEE